jgi:phosphate transport system substrate-binding protein
MFRHGEHWKRSIYEFSNAADGTDAGQLIVNAIASDPDAIGISNIHYATAAVKPLPISTDANSSPIAPTKANVRSRAYPLTRAVYIVLGNDLKGPPGVAIREFMRFVLSREGGSAVEKEGNYLPLPAPIAASQLLQLDRP